MAASKFTESAVRKNSKVTETVKKTVATPPHASMAPKKGESLAASLFGGSGPGPKGVGRTSFRNLTLPHKVNLLKDDDAPAVAAPTSALGLSPTGKQKIPSVLTKARILPLNVVPIGGDAKKMSSVSSPKVVGAGDASPTASTPTPRTSIVEPGRKSAKVDAPTSIGHQSFGQKAVELFSWGSKRSKSRSYDTESNMARRLGKKSWLQMKKTADIKNGSVFFPSMQDVKVVNKVEVARESAMPSLDALSALKNRTLTHYSEFLNADDMTARAKRVAKRQKIAVCFTISIVFLILALLVVYFLGLISLSKDSHSYNATRRFHPTMTTTEGCSTAVTTRKIKHKPRTMPSDWDIDVSKLMTTRVPAGFVSATNNSTIVAIQKSITAEDGNETVKKKGLVSENYSTINTLTETSVTTTNNNDFGAKTSVLKLDDMI